MKNSEYSSQPELRPEFLDNPSRRPQTGILNKFSESNINFGRNYILTWARVGFPDTDLTRRIERDGPDIQLEPLNSNLMYFGPAGNQVPEPSSLEN